jgi:uncharacterized membrane protein
MGVQIKRHIAKAITYRFLTTIISIFLVWIFTSEFELALKFGAIEMIIKLLTYYFHERIWYKWIKFGIKK